MRLVYKTRWIFVLEEILRNQMVSHKLATMSLQIKNQEIERDVFQAIAHPTRRAILALIAFQAMTPNAIAAHFDSSRQAVSKHIRILSECRLVTQEQKGREIYYHTNPKEMKKVDDFMEPFRKMWDERFNKLEEVMKKRK